MSVSDDLVLRMRAQGTRRAARDVDEVTSSVDRFGLAVDRADKKVNKLSGLQTALFAFGPALVPALAAATGGLLSLGAAFGPAALGAVAFGSVFKSQVTAVGTAASAIEKAQNKVNATYGPQFVSQHTAAVKQLTLLNRQLTAQFGAGGPAIVAKYAAVSNAVQQFKQSLNPQTFHLLGSGLGLVQKLLPRIRPLLVAVANAFIKITDSLSKGVGGPGFRKFIAWMTAEAPKGILAFAHIIGNLARGFYELFRAFLPTSNGMRKGLVDMTAAFANWAAHLGTNGGFQRFLAYLKDSGPKVLHTLGQMVLAIVHLAPALAAAGASSLILLNALAGVIGWLTHVPVVGAFVGALVPFVVIATKLGPLIKGISVAIGILTLTSARSVPVFWALNAALSVNPFVLAAAAILALGVAFYAAYTHSKRFRDGVNSLAADIKSGLGGALNWVVDKVNAVIGGFNHLIDLANLIPGVHIGHIGAVGHVDFATHAAPTKRRSGVIGHGDAGPAVGVTKPVGSPYVGAGDAGPAVGVVKPLGAQPDTVIHIHHNLDGKQIGKSVVRVSNQAKAAR